MGLSLWVGTCKDDFYLVHSKKNIILGWSNMRILEVDFGLLPHGILFLHGRL